MQDRYTGDVGDFGKYGLLRALRGNDSEALRLGVIWYRTDESIVEADSGNDGKHIGYLSSDKERDYRPCDPPLYDHLRGIVRRGERRVAEIEQSGLLGPDARFHDDYVPGPAKRASEHARQASVARRRQWVQDARRSTKDCDLLFLDPDNGLEIQSVRNTTFNAPKYVFLDEVKDLLGRGQSMVIYQQRTHEGSDETQFGQRRDELQQLLSKADMFALRFGRGTARHFIVVATAKHSLILRERAKEMLDTPWRKHFCLIDPD